MNYIDFIYVCIALNIFIFYLFHLNRYINDLELVILYYLNNLIWIISYNIDFDKIIPEIINEIYLILLVSVPPICLIVILWFILWKIMSLHIIDINNINNINREPENLLCCSICLDDINTDDDKYITKCNHIYHKNCLNKWDKNTCPNCRLIYK
jgi:hypothetical protein